MMFSFQLGQWTPKQIFMGFFTSFMWSVFSGISWKSSFSCAKHGHSNVGTLSYRKNLGKYIQVKNMRKWKAKRVQGSYFCLSRAAVHNAMTCSLRQLESVPCAASPILFTQQHCFGCFRVLSFRDRNSGWLSLTFQISKDSLLLKYCCNRRTSFAGFQPQLASLCPLGFFPLFFPLSSGLVSWCSSGCPLTASARAVLKSQLLGCECMCFNTPEKKLHLYYGSQKRINSPE